MKELNSVREAAEHTRVSEGWWRQRIAQRRVRFVRIGGRNMIPGSEIERIIQEGTVEPVEKQ